MYVCVCMSLIDIDYFFYIDDKEREKEDLLIEENNKQCLFFFFEKIRVMHISFDNISC